MALLDHYLLVSSSNSSCVVDLSYMSDFSNESNMSSHHFVEGLNDTRIMGESVSAHNMVKLVDHSMGMSSSMSDYGVKLIDKSVMLNDRVHLILVHFHITF